MKTTRGNNTKQSKQSMPSHLKKPEIRVDLDSRKNKEGGYRGHASKKGDRKKKSFK